MRKLSGLFLFAVLISGVFSSSVAFAQIVPIAEDDAYSVDEDSLLTVDPIGVLLNDTNTQSDTFHPILQTDVGFGVLTLNQDGSFTYQPNENFDLTDSFTYILTDGTNNSNEATVTISVNPINDLPIAIDDSAETIEDTPLDINTVDLLSNDLDVDNESLSITTVTSGSGGVVLLNDNETIDDTTDDYVTFTPDENFNGNADFNYTVSDGFENATGTVNITVVPQNDSPIANDDHAETQQNVPIRLDVLENDSDVEDDSLDILLIVDPSETKGFVEIENSEIIFTPIADFVGTTTFSYMISDGDKTSNSAKVTVTVNEGSNNDSILDELLTQIQSLFDRILTLEDEITQLKEENTALSLQITELESSLDNDLPTNNDEDNSKDVDDNVEKIIVCHKGKNTISISEHALFAHLKHGDEKGACNSDNDDD